MARKRRSRSPERRKRRRYPRSSRVLKPLPFTPSPTRVSLLTLSEARRIPGYYRSLRTTRREAPITYGVYSQRTSYRPKPPRTKKEVLMFASPRYTIMCIKRKIRKEVMFAVRKAGQKGKQKKPRITEESRIRC